MNTYLTMERLTEPGGSRCEGCQDAGECAYIAGEFPVPCPDAVRYDRLKVYEDTGLEPGAIKNMAENAETRLLTWFESQYGFPAGELMQILEAKQDGRLVVFPKVAEADWQAFVDGLHDYFIESKFEDRSVGIFGMTDGEIALADALMKALTREEYVRLKSSVLTVEQEW